MPLPSAREIERHYFEQFRQHFPVPDGRVIYADKPDVRLLGDSTIGIEIVRLYLTDGGNPVSEQRQSSVVVDFQSLNVTVSAMFTMSSMVH